MTQQSIGQTLEIIRNQHKALLLQVEEPGEVDLEQVQILLKTLAQSGATIEDAEDRSLLHELIRYWSSFINDRTGEFPAVQLQPFDASLIHSRSTRRPKFFQMAVESPELTMEGQSRQSLLANRKAIEPSMSLISRSNRQRMLERVRSTWIKGVLEQSLHGATLIALKLRERPDVLANPWRLVVQEVDQIAYALPTGKHITQVYDDAESALLILGEPGAGKTTLLLELTRDLLDRAQKDENLPIPVVFSLSSWAKEQPPLTEWLVEELNIRYEVPRRLSQPWVTNNTLLLLLDGLDEVSPAARKECIQAINVYRQEHPFVPVVVCSRSDDYLNQPARLRLHAAVIVQPLTQEQTDAYLVSAGTQVGALREALRTDSYLQELATTPLMLNILTLAYQGMPLDEITALESLKTRQRQVFDSYVERMLHRRRAETHYTPHQTMQWLAWLARQLVRHSQTIIFIELMQPDWLETERSQRAYERLAIQLPGNLIGALVSLIVNNFLLSTNIVYEILYVLIGGLIGGLISGSTTAQQFPKREIGARNNSWRRLFLSSLRNGVLIGLSVGLSTVLAFRSNHWFQIGLIFGVGFGLGSFFLSFTFLEEVKTRQQTELTVITRTGMWHHLIKTGYIRNGLQTGLIVGLSFGLTFGLSFGLSAGLNYGLSIGLSNGLEYGLSFGLIGGLLSVILAGMSGAIQPADIIVWSWRSTYRSLINVRHLRNRVLVGVLIGLTFGLSAGLNYGLSIGLEYGLSFGLSSGLSYWLILGLFRGVSSGTLNDHDRVRPNQGIQHSARNSIILGLISGCVIWLIYILNSILKTALYIGLSTGLTVGLSNGLSTGLTVGLAGGLLVGFLNGGLAFLRHRILRWLLWSAKYMPWNYPRFLDYASERILLRKIGGGYIFVHRLLLEYFIALDTPTVPSVETEQVMNVLQDQNG